jgi:NAD(P)-dependent dehydrogenase (short-subunit alcohol dehydrogenase family)
MSGPAERCVVITGAGGGLGRAFALGFAATGARVVAVDLDDQAAVRTAALVTEAGEKRWPWPPTSPTRPARR